MTNKTKKPSSLVAVILLALAVTLLIVAMSRMRLDGLSTFIARLLQGAGETELSPEQQVYAGLLDRMNEPETAPPQPLNAISLSEAFSQFAFADTYTHRYTVTYTDGERRTTRCISLVRDGERYQLLIFNGDRVDPGELMLSAEGDSLTYVVRDTMGNEHLYMAGEDFPLSSVAMLPDTDTFCAWMAEYERDPTTAALSACTAEMAESADGRVLTLRMTMRDTGREEVYRYLLDYGILYDASSTQDGLTYYEVKTLFYSPDPQVEEAEE